MASAAVAATGRLGLAAGVKAAGYASAGMVAGLAVGEAFEHGGVVGGSSYSGDRVPARVNSGEMILNKGQQNHLWKAANGIGGGGGSGGSSSGIASSTQGSGLKANNIWRK